MSKSREVQIEGPRFLIQGKSRAGNETWFRVRELGIALDIGRCPDQLVGTTHVFVTHTHLDHALGIPFYAAQRRLHRLPAGHVYIPAEALDDYHELMRLHEKLEDTEYPLNLHGLSAGDEVELRRDLMVRVHRSTHRVPTNAYEFLDRRVKLDGEFLQMDGKEIARMKREGKTHFHVEAQSLLYYTGDTDRRTLENNPALYGAEVLIIECSFTGPHDRARALQFAHIHIDDLFERADLFENEIIVLSHFSLRNSPEEIHRNIGARCPDRLRSRLRLVLPEPWGRLDKKDE